MGDVVVAEDSSGRTSRTSASMSCSSVSISEFDSGSLRSCMRVKTMEQSLSSKSLATSDSIRSTRSHLANNNNNADEDYDGDDDDDNDNNSEELREIRFEKVEVRDYPLILGDNPSVTDGPPLSIDWDHAGEYAVSVEEYENTRPPRRHKKNMVVPKSVRQDWLRDEGYSRGEMNEAEKLVLKAKKERMATAKKRAARLVLEEKREAVQRTLRRVFSRKPKPNDLYDTWKPSKQRMVN
mmetsp:Transcript_10889/g.18416  ORF Transcript_10889/g.18416 Transcript_10889/m.18416 type:complete len:238 (-) Transcript_10889:156-869(-)